MWLKHVHGAMKRVRSFSFLQAARRFTLLSQRQVTVTLFQDVVVFNGIATGLTVVIAWKNISECSHRENLKYHKLRFFYLTTFFSVHGLHRTNDMFGGYLEKNGRADCCYSVRMWLVN
jgi:hypothetical protein